MSPIDWLCDKAVGFEELSAQERDSIMHFSLLWSYFEARALGNYACAKSITDLVRKWENRLNTVAFDESLAYFKQRYFRNGSPTERFRGLRFQKQDKQDLVEAVLKGENTDKCDCIAALLIVIYRLRNNLFHGNKWDYDLRGQLDNFKHANAVLMRASEIA